MSRLIVKNLPAYLTQDGLRKHFTVKEGPGGTITDVKVLLKPDGTSRRFGFVGYKTDEEARKAQKWFNKTYVQGSRIGVEIVEGAKDAPAPRPNKRPRLGSSPTETTREPAQQPTKKGKAATQEKTGGSKDSQLDEYMQVMQRKKGPSWKDADAIPDAAPTPAPPSTDKPFAWVDDADEDAGADAMDADEAAGTQPSGVSDMDWLKQRMRANLEIRESEPEKVFQQSDEEDENGASSSVPRTAEKTDKLEQAAEDEDETTAAIMRTGRLFLRNLAFSCSDAELMELFQPFGAVAQVHIPLDAVTKAPKGMAYVTFSDPTNAVAAYEALDKKSFQGRLLHILPAVDRRGNVAVEDVAGRAKSLKEERDAKRKGTAGREFNWSMLYMNSDAVVSSIADRMQLSKAEILNPESDNAAVKLALAETHVVQETKAFLEQNGVVLSSLTSSTDTNTNVKLRRSDTTILVKNIPYGTSAEEIRALFEPHGELTRVLVPPAGTMAVVEFRHADEGKKAFRAVAYRRMGNSIIYLEKGPVGMFVPPEDSAQDGEAKGPVVAMGAKPVAIAAQGSGEEAEQGQGQGQDSAQEQPSLSSGTTLFLKNLAFRTTTATLTSALQHLSDFAFARVQTKPDPKRPTQENARLSMGYGFVGFKNAEAARKAVKGLDGYVLEGHKLVASFAGRGAEEEKEKKSEGAGKGMSKTTTKMIVKNVPFEATKKDIRELFGAHGHLKSVRVPKKFDHRARGFAFLDFATRREAENAYETLRHTHLLGRHLVLEWAADDSEGVDVEELRRKAGVGFGDGKDLPGRKRKLEIGEKGGEVEAEGVDA